MTDHRLGDASHTPPHRDRNPVQRRYQRGRDTVADGGAPDTDAVENEAGGDAEEAATLKDVDHTPPDGEGVNNVYQRGRMEE
jgi:hypothetical protein